MKVTEVLFEGVRRLFLLTMKLLEICNAKTKVSSFICYVFREMIKVGNSFDRKPVYCTI